jgi:hypothetical protein
MSLMKCPYCGREYSMRACRPLIPIHEFPEPSLVCPGSNQYPRNAESDRRPLWKDDQDLQDKP